MTKKRRILTLTVLAGAIAAAPALKSEGPQAGPDFRILADRYERMAARQDEVAEDHVKMKEDYRTHQDALPKKDRRKSLSELNRHCDAIVAGSRKLAEEYRAMASWHGEHAGEIQPSPPPRKHLPPRSPFEGEGGEKHVR